MTPRSRATVDETSAGGLVVRKQGDQFEVALIARYDRRHRLVWSLPKGHIEQGETAEQTAIREVAEETGIHGDVLAALGRIEELLELNADVVFALIAFTALARTFGTARAHMPAWHAH